jgi:hypothetical protein
VESLRLAAARYSLSRETGETLRALAERLLSEGHEQAVRLAIADDLSMSAIAPLFECLCRELQQQTPPMQDPINIVITGSCATSSTDRDTGGRAAASHGRRVLTTPERETSR